MVVVFAPVDDEIAAWQGHHYLAAGQPAAGSSHGGGAGGGAASAREPGATLPGPEPQGGRPSDLRERDVGALGKQRIVSDGGSEAGKVVRYDILDEENAVGVTDIDNRRCAETQVCEVRQLDCSRVIERLAERDLVPLEARDAQVDGDAAVLSDRRRQHPALRLDADVRRPALGDEQCRHAARSIAARADLATVCIPNAHENVGKIGGLERYHLVATDASAPVGDRGNLRGAERKRPSARIEHDEIVAESVHLAELDAAGHELCRSTVRPLYGVWQKMELAQ